jgi:hypothetical protein
MYVFRGLYSCLVSSTWILFGLGTGQELWPEYRPSSSCYPSRPSPACLRFLDVGLYAVVPRFRRSYFKGPGKAEQLK